VPEGAAFERSRVDPAGSGSSVAVTDRPAPDWGPDVDDDSPTAEIGPVLPGPPPAPAEARGAVGEGNGDGNGSHPTDLQAGREPADAGPATIPGDLDAFDFDDELEGLDDVSDHDIELVVEGLDGGPGHDRDLAVALDDPDGGSARDVAVAVDEPDGGRDHDEEPEVEGLDDGPDRHRGLAVALDDADGDRDITVEVDDRVDVDVTDDEATPAPTRLRRHPGTGQQGTTVATATATAGGTATAAATRTPTRRPVAEAPAVTRPAAGKLGYLPALDGLRAVAVLLVLGYHLGYSGLAGGYIGVELFFILSGWLVCALLMSEAKASGRIALGHFWLRRARRLLPAMVAVTVVTLGVATLLTPDRVADLRADAFAALTYHLNWKLILDHQSYFAAADGPSALEHLWSLSIEEQFYLVFPLLAAGVLAKWRTGWALALVVGAVLVSTVLRFAWYETGTDPSSIYFSTVTRAAGLLGGVALALVWVPRRLRPRTSWQAGRVVDVLALAGIGVILWYTTSVTEQEHSAFRLSFSLVQGATLLAIAALVVPGSSWVGALLGTRPLTWIGQRSYGIYLIHWPVIVFTSRAPGQQPEAPGKVVLQVLGVGVLAAISYKVIEEPIRRHGLAETAGAARRRLGRVLAGRPLATAAGLALVVVVGGGTWAVGAEVFTADPPAETHAESVVISAPSTTAPATTAPPSTQPTAVTAAPPTAPVTTVAPAPAYPPTTLVGDSVMVGGADALSQRLGGSLVTLNAEVGRQMGSVPDVLRQLAGAGQLGSTVVIHLGNNGSFSAAEVDEAFSVVGPDRQVVLVNVFVPRRWEGEVNDALNAAVARHPNARLADWRSIPAAAPGLLAGDGYHLNTEGAQRYAEVVTTAVAATAL
jgi:peptidoglycan/LPS O-acetylase OafA/YrhL